MKKIHIIAFRVAPWDTLDASLAYFSLQEEDGLSVLMASVICVPFSQLIDHCVT